MNGFIAVIAALAVVCATTGALASEAEHAQWYCNTAGAQSIVKAVGAPVRWTNQNNAICKTTCSGAYPVYMTGNFALFTDGLHCCCAAQVSGPHHYSKTFPHISLAMVRQLGLDSRDPPTD